MAMGMGEVMLFIIKNPTEGVNSACTNPVDNSPKEEIPIIMIPNN